MNRLWMAAPCALLVVASACGSGSETNTSADPDGGPTSVRLVTHDSFLVSDGIFEQFTADTGITVEVTSGGDAGELVARAVLTAGQPEADVMFGIDTTFLQRGLDEDLFVAHKSSGLEAVPDELELDSEHRVTPIDVGDVCVNYSLDALPEGGPPTSLDDLVDPRFADQFVTENPETSSPGFAFLLATIAKYGDDWPTFWEGLVANNVEVVGGWNDAYYGSFVAGGGSRSLVTSYASSPVAEVVFADPPIDSPSTAVLADSCFRQIEFAGILRGTDVPDAAGQLIDFMLSPTFQADIPLNMFVEPANADVALPEVYAANATEIVSPLTLTPAEIEEHRNDWTEQWLAIIRQ